MFCFKNVSHSQTRKVHHMESSSLCKIPVVNLVHFTHRPNFYGLRDVGLCVFLTEYDQNSTSVCDSHEMYC